MKSVTQKREQEKYIITQMIRLYCRKNHKSKRSLCEECEALVHYAMQRSDNCLFMEKKSFCSNCKVHCYNNEMRTKIRKVMRFSGPRMIFYHPVMAAKHVIATRKEKRRTNGNRSS